MDILSGNKNIHLVYISVDYNNDSYFSGRDIGLDQYNLSAQLSYNYRNFTLRAAALMYESLFPPLQLATFSASYRLPINFPLHIDLNYDRFFFFNESDTLMSQYPNSLGFSLSYHQKFWGMLADVSILASRESVSPQLNPALYGKFELFSWKENKISIKPEISFVFGSEVNALTRAPWQGNQSFAKPINGGNGNGQGNGNGNGPDPTTPGMSDAFGLLNTELNIHILLDMGDIDFDICIQNNRPRSIIRDLTFAPTSMLSISAGYAFTFLTK